MNDNNNKKKNIKIDGVSVLSFVVAAFVIVSMVALGFNQVSYAAPDVTGDPDKYSDLLKNGFTTKEFDNSTDRLYSDSGSSFGIDMHFAELSCTSGDACKGGRCMFLCSVLNKQKHLMMERLMPELNKMLLQIQG